MIEQYEDCGAKGRHRFRITYQSPLPVLRPLAPPSLDVFPAAAEAKLEVNGEGIIFDLEFALLGPEECQSARNRASSLNEGLGGGSGRSFLIMRRGLGSVMATRLCSYSLVIMAL